MNIHKVGDTIKVWDYHFDGFFNAKLLQTADFDKEGDLSVLVQPDISDKPMAVWFNKKEKRWEIYDGEVSHIRYIEIIPSK